MEQTPPEAIKLLVDARESARAIVSFTQGKTVADLPWDRPLRSAIYFEFAVIGEALTQLRPVAPDALEHISESHRIIRFRNQIIHGYARIDDEITWRVIQDKRPILMQNLDHLLAS